MNSSASFTSIANPISNKKMYRVGAWCIPIILMAALIQNYSEIQSVMSGEALKLYQVQGPIIVRALKDLTYISIIIAILLHSVQKKLQPISIGMFIIFAISIFLSVRSIEEHDLLTAAIGIRWITPLLIFMFARFWVLDFEGEKSIYWIYAALLICFSLQVYQLFNMPPVYGTIFGFSARTPGIFLAPNSASFFGCACAAYIHVFSRGRFAHLLLSTVLASLITALAQSGTGAVVCVALLLHTFFARSPAVVLTFLALAIPATFANLDAILGRDSFVELSGGGRIERFQEIVQQSAFEFNNFGYYTNAANLADKNPQFRFAVDSLWASIIGNYGLFSLFIIVTFFFFLKKNFSGMKFIFYFSPLLVFFMFSFTTIVFEAYPMNILLILAIWGARKLSIEQWS